MARPAMLEAIVKKINPSLTGTAVDSAVDNLVESVASKSPLEFNTWITEMFNKVLRSALIQKVLFSHPLITHYINMGHNITEFTEFFEVKNMEALDYNPDNKFLQQNYKPKTLSVVIGKGIKKVVPITIQYDFIKQVFASPQGAAQWLGDVMSKVQESISMQIYDYIIPKIVDGVKNEIDLSTITAPDTFLIELNTLTDKMKLKTNAFNLGFTSTKGVDGEYKSNGKDDETMINTLSRDKMLLIASPELFNVLDGKVGAVKFHNEYFNVKSYGEVCVIEAKYLKKGDKPFLMVLDGQNAFKGWYQLESTDSNNWGLNKTTDLFNHYWIKFGAIPWANGVKVLYNKDLLKNA